MARTSTKPKKPQAKAKAKAKASEVSVLLDQGRPDPEFLVHYVSGAINVKFHATLANGAVLLPEQLLKHYENEHGVNFDLKAITDACAKMIDA